MHSRRAPRPRIGWMAMLIAGGLGLGSPAQAEPRARVLTVPGFADFIAVDGDTVWVTNRGAVEHWSHTRKLASVPMAHPCGAMTIAAGSLWVGDCKDRTLNRIDLRTARITATIATGIAVDGEMNVVSGAGSIWIASAPGGMVARVDPADNRIVASIPVSPSTTYLAFGFGSLWAVSGPQQTVQKIDPATDQVVHTAALGKQPGFLAAGEGAVWVQEQADGTLAKIDPQTGEVAGRVKVGVNLKYGDVDTGGGKVWLRTTDDQSFVVIDPKTLAIRARIGTAEGSGALRYTPRGIWTTAHDKHTLSWWKDPAAIGN